jgi:hypothetical protein
MEKSSQNYKPLIAVIKIAVIKPSITTWKTRGKYSPSDLAGGGGTLGVRFGLAHFSNGLWFFDDFSKLK